jgi:hypothetical protein
MPAFDAARHLLLAAAALGAMAGCGGAKGGVTTVDDPGGTPAANGTAKSAARRPAAVGVPRAEVPIGGRLRDALLTGLNGAQQWDGPDALALIERDFGGGNR